MTGQQINIPAADGGEFSAHLALPSSGSTPLIVILHEIYGVTDWVRETAEMFAARDYVVVSDMFWRLEPDFEADHRDSA